MMPNVTRGDRMAGLLNYLAGPGDSNEHDDIHLVAASDLIVSHAAGEPLSQDQARMLAREMDVPRNSFDTKVPKGHVIHISLSLRADERVQSDERWAEIANDFVTDMGFTEASGKAPCRWVAVRHGLSAKGNDHIHLAVSVIREDGTRWSDWNDYKNAQGAARRIEEKYGYVKVGGLNAERGYSRAEQKRATAQGLPELDRETLHRKVRAAAAASVDEAEFVRRLRGTGVLVRPRFATGRTDVVEGFSVALKPPTRQSKPVWFGGGRLARDLTLPKLREDWPDTPQDAAAASAEWNAAARNGRVVTPGRETAAPTEEQWQTYTAEIGALYDRVKNAPADDRELWAKVARETSGAFAAWSVRTESTPGPLAETAKLLSRSAQLTTFPPKEKHAPLPSTKGAGMLLMQAAVGPSSAAGERLLLAQLTNTVKAIAGMQREVGNLREAELIRVHYEDRLGQIHTSLADVDSFTQDNPWLQAAEPRRVPTFEDAPVIGPELPAKPRVQFVELTDEQRQAEEALRLSRLANGARHSAVPAEKREPTPATEPASDLGPEFEEMNRLRAATKPPARAGKGSPAPTAAPRTPDTGKSAENDKRHGR